MYFILLFCIVYLYLKFRDISKDYEDLCTHIDDIENIIEKNSLGGNNEEVTVEK